MWCGLSISDSSILVEETIMLLWLLLSSVLNLDAMGLDRVRLERHSTRTARIVSRTGCAAVVLDKKRRKERGSVNRKVTAETSSYPTF